MGKYVSILYRQEKKYINKAMKPFGLGFSSYNFLMYISKNEGVNQKQLCDILSLDEALGTRTMKKLEEKGFILRKRDAHDQRCYTLYLTQKGKEILPELKKLLFDYWSSLTQELNSQEISLLLKQLEQMSKKAISMSKIQKLK